MKLHQCIIDGLILLINKDKIMNQTGYSSAGPKCFGTSKRTSFVDVRDDDIPGPGSHNSSRLDRNTPTKWKFGTSTERDSFLQKYPRPNPSPFSYNPNPTPTLTAHPHYSFPKSELENAACYKQDENCRIDYDPNSNINKNAPPSYGFGYAQERDYGSEVPASNTYDVSSGMKLRDRTVFNKTENYFYKADRPLPYGDWGSNPGVGEYSINSTDPMNKTAHKFGQSQKLLDPKFQGTTPIKYYDIAGEIKQPGKGYTMRPYYQGVKNKDVQIFPAPNHYNPKFIDSRKKIISFTSQRSELYEKDHIKYPSPQKHVTSSDFYKKRKSLSFTKEPRYEEKPLEGPGPAKYNVQTKLSDERGYMGHKLKKFTEFVTPAGSNYNPVDHLTKPLAQRVINYHTSRVDFSKSITGNVGPGDYLQDKDTRGELGKMSKSLKFQKNRNKNPGPGFYEIPTSIGKLPKYYSAKKKLTTTGFSTFALELEQKTRRQQQWIKQKQLEKQRQEQAMRKLAQEAAEEAKAR